MNLPEKYETIEFTSNNKLFTVKNTGNNAYILRDTNDNFHTRWGNAKEILEDIAYVMNNGSLPKSKNKGWF